MWTADNRPRYNRDKRHDQSDLTDEEWSLIAPLIPTAKRGGQRRSVDLREVAKGLLSVLSTGCRLPHSDGGRNRQALRCRPRLRRIALPMGRRTHLRLAQPVPPPGQGR